MKSDLISKADDQLLISLKRNSHSGDCSEFIHIYRYFHCMAMQIKIHIKAIVIVIKIILVDEEWLHFKGRWSTSDQSLKFLKCTDHLSSIRNQVNIVLTYYFCECSLFHSRNFATDTFIFTSIRQHINRSNNVNVSFGQVTIMDLNDNCPELGSMSTQIETVPALQQNPLIYFSASDADAGLNGEVSYFASATITE